MANQRVAATEPNGGRGADEARKKRGALDRLNGASNIIVASMAVVATVISLFTLHMQSQDQAVASQDRAAAALKAQTAFAHRIVPLWTASADGLSVYFHIQNDNALPVEVWLVYLPGDNQVAPGSSGDAAATKPGKKSPRGVVVFPPSVFIGQVPPCTEVEVHAPFASYAASNFTHSSYQTEGDAIFIDPSGLIWAISPSGALRRIQYKATQNFSGTNTINFLITKIIVKDQGQSQGIININHTVTWASHNRSPICG